jgi:N-acyl-D-amino-acid deacylase
VGIDLVIRQGTILDGTASEAFQADLAIENGRIVEIGRVEANGVASLDAEGMYVTPGFIDIHSHSDWTLLVDPRAVSAIHQGVTLEVLGNCGHGCFPIRNPEISKQIILGFSDDIAFDWSETASYFDRLEKIGPAVNVLSLVPNGQLRLAAMGFSTDPASPEQASEMQVLLKKSLEEGAWGYSTGLEFASEAGASELEVTELCKTVKSYGGLYATHTRERGDSGAVEAVEEALRTARTSGVRLQISHLLPRRPEDYERCVEVVDAARESGLDVHFDMHTRPFGLSFLHFALPSWLNPEPQSLRKQLADPKVRDKMKKSPTILSANSDWNRVILLDNPIWPQYARRSVAEIASERGQDALDVVYDLLLKNPEEMHELMVIVKSMYSDRQQQDVFSHPLCMPGSDATDLATDGTLANSTFHGAYTWAAWFYRFMVREKKALTPEEAVHKMTGLPASILGLSDRGVLRTGSWADLAIFDPEIFGEQGTTFEPNQLAKGMRYVLVNGNLTLDQGKLTGERTGKVIRRERMS